MEKIEVDFDVWKILTTKRIDEKDTYNDVLRRLLGLPPAAIPNHKGKSWIIKGI